MVKYSDTCVNMNLESFSFTEEVVKLDANSPNLITSLQLTSEFMYFLPDNIFNFFPELTNINIYTVFPQIMKLETGQFEGLVKLKRVNIVNQHIRHLGEGIFRGAPNITHLFLPSNQIEKIAGKAFDDLKECIFLVLRNNRLTRLERYTFQHMKKLWSVNLAKNLLKSLSGYSFSNSTLAVLDLSYNNFTRLPSSFFKDFNITTDEKRLLSVRGFNACGNKIYRGKSNISIALLENENCFQNHWVKKSKLKISDQPIVRRNLQQKRQKKVKAQHFTENFKPTISNECDSQQCYKVVGKAFDEQREIIKNLLPQLKQWQQDNEQLQTSLSKVNNQESCAANNQAKFIPGNDCASAEEELSDLKTVIKDLKDINTQLVMYVQTLMDFAKQKLSEEVKVEEPVEILGNEASIKELKNKILNLESEKLTLIKKKKVYKCDHNEQNKELNEMLNGLHAEIIKKDEDIKELMDLNVELAQKASEINGEKINKLKESYSLREEHGKFIEN